MGLLRALSQSTRAAATCLAGERTPLVADPRNPHAPVRAPKVRPTWRPGTAGSSGCTLSSLIDIEKLTPDQRLDLIGELWDSLDHSPIELAEDVRALLDQRIAEMEQDPSGGLSLDEVLADLTRARVRR